MSINYWEVLLSDAMPAISAPIDSLAFDTLRSCFEPSTDRRKGNCWDNAPSESFFNSLKNKRVHGTIYATRADAKADLFEYIEMFYNWSCRHSTLGYNSPVQCLQEWINKHAAQQSMAAKERAAGRRNSRGASLFRDCHRALRR